MQLYMERIDVENDEYAAWDANGQPVTLSVQKPIWLKLIPNLEGGGPDLRASLRQFARNSGIQLSESEERLDPLRLHEVIEAKVPAKPKSFGIFRFRK
jgi:hypothetical protein